MSREDAEEAAAQQWQDERNALESGLATWLPERRWFRAKSRAIAGVKVADVVPFDGGPTVVIVRVSYQEGDGDDYALILNGNELKDLLPETAAKLLAAFDQPLLKGWTPTTSIHFEALPALAARRNEPGATFEPKPVSTEQTNSSIVYGNSFVLKILRQLDEGTSPDMEMGEFLTLAGYEHAPALAGTIVVERADREAATLGLLHRFTTNQGDAWTFTLSQLKAHHDDTALAELLGKRVGQMHVALASRADLPAFAPERLDRERRNHMVMAAKHSLEKAAAAVKRARGEVPALTNALPAINARLDAFVTMNHDPIATRVHGDLHLGQVLFTGADFMIIDFEGEPARPLLERKAKRSPFVDVAGMLRSYHYAAMSGSSGDAARSWYAAMRSAFMRGWTGATVQQPLLAMDQTALDFALLEKCIYEVNYEADNRPDWIAIPLEGLLA